MDNNELSYGQKAVGTAFNPSGDPGIDKLKRLYADIIDLLAADREVADSAEAKRLYSVAITETQGAQMWSVKARAESKK